MKLALRLGASLLLAALAGGLDSQARSSSPLAALSKDEVYRFGLYKLEPGELAALGAWIEQVAAAGCRETARQDRKRVDEDPVVSFNTSSHKFHCLSCASVQRCTRNCVEMRRSEAISRGGVACQNCGGSCQ